MSSIKAALRVCAAVFCLFPVVAIAADVKIAVASNFRPVMERLVEVFEANSDHDVQVSYGSSGKHYAQIVNGAPHELFLAADPERPHRLEQDGMAIPGSRFTYAIGRLVLWMPNSQSVQDGERVLRDGNFRFLAIANPRSAPYGKAAEQLLRHLGIFDQLQSHLVRGENVAQAFAYVKSGNADLGLLALSQVIQLSAGPRGSAWLVPQRFHEPIEQQAVLLKDNAAAREFMQFLRGQEALALISESGYELP